MNDITIQNNSESQLKTTSPDKQAPQTESTSFGKITDSDLPTNAIKRTSRIISGGLKSALIRLKLILAK
jgi:hypothetical protein